VLLGDEEWARWSNREIGRRACVSRRFVDQVRESLGTVPSERTYTTKHGTVSTMDTSNIGKGRQEDRPDQPEPDDSWYERADDVTEEDDDRQDQPVADGKRHDPALGGAPRSDHDSDEWYTPAAYVEAARVALGRIDLDPASSAEAQKTIGAELYFDKDADGLRQPWHGRVWLNPPFSQPAASLFAAKLLEEIDAGRVEAAILLQHSSTATRWFQDLASRSTVCFPRRRINFDRADGFEGMANRYGQVFFYLGPDRDAFCDAFRPFGLCGELR